MQLIFFGSSQFSVTALQALLDNDHEIVTVYTQGAKPSGRGHRDVLSPVHQYALEKNFSVRTPKNFKDKKFSQPSSKILKEKNHKRLAQAANSVKKITLRKQP